MSPKDRARQRTHFFDQYRSYVINYNLGKDLVRAYIEKHGGTEDHPDVRWQRVRQAARVTAAAVRTAMKSDAQMFLHPRFPPDGPLSARRAARSGGRTPAKC